MDHREYTYGADLLRDRIIMVTGASDGIGREIALHAAAHGAQVVLHGRNVAKLEAVYDEIERLEGIISYEKMMLREIKQELPFLKEELEELEKKEEQLTEQIRAVAAAIRRIPAKTAKRE